MTFQEQRILALEHQYRKLERGVLLMMKAKRDGRNFNPATVQRKIGEMKNILTELGHKPSTPRWPL
jgi:hypothetical protein